MHCSYSCPQTLVLPTKTSGFWLGIDTKGVCEVFTNAIQIPVAVAYSPAYQNFCFVARRWHRRCMRGVAGVAGAWRGHRCPRVLLLGANNGDEVIQLSPILLFCYVWLVLMVVVIFGLGYTPLRFPYSCYMCYVVTPPSPWQFRAPLSCSLVRTCSFLLDV
jgi:hypothetical protein